MLGQARTRAELSDCIQKAFCFYYSALEKLEKNQVPVDQLVINGKVSYALEAYKASTASVRAARQMEAAGMLIKPGMRIRFIYRKGEPDVFAWDLGKPIDPSEVNKPKYVELLAKAGSAVLAPFGISEALFREWSENRSIQLKFDREFLN